MDMMVPVLQGLTLARELKKKKKRPLGKKNWPMLVSMSLWPELEAYAEQRMRMVKEARKEFQ